MTLVKNLEQKKNHLLTMIGEITDRLSKKSSLENEHYEVISKQRVKMIRLESKIKELENEKEAAKAKHRRSIRISEYSRNLSGSAINRPVTRSYERFTTEIDRLKFK